MLSRYSIRWLVTVLTEYWHGVARSFAVHIPSHQGQHACYIYRQQGYSASRPIDLDPEDGASDNPIDLDGKGKRHKQQYTKRIDDLSLDELDAINETQDGTLFGNIGEEEVQDDDDANSEFVVIDETANEVVDGAVDDEQVEGLLLLEVSSLFMYK